MGILSYLGILVLIPLFVSRKDAFVKFHAKQGLVLLIIEAIAWILIGSFWGPLWILFRLIKLGVFILSIIGIINVLNKKEKELPIVGSWAKNFNF